MNIKKPVIKHVSVKEAVLPFNKFPEEDAILGPEMKSTGEAMGIGDNFGIAFAKSQMSLSLSLPKEGKVFISLSKKSRMQIIESVKSLSKMGFQILATEGTKETLEKYGISAEHVHKIDEGRPNLVDHLINGDVSLIVNNPGNRKSIDDGKYIRQAAVRYNVPLITTVQGFIAAVSGIESLVKGDIKIASLQELY